MKNRSSIILLLLSFIFSFSSCVKKLDIIEENEPDISANDITDLSANENFNWKTTSDVNISIQTLDNTATAIPNIKVSIYSDYKALGGTEIISGLTKENGLLELDYVF